MSDNIKVFLAILLISGASSLAFLGYPDVDSNNDDIKNAQAAKVSINEAIQQVQSNHDGVVITAILEDKSDAGLVYEIDLIQGKKEMEVWVDAKTGLISEIMTD